jgi:hypothetical protein
MAWTENGAGRYGGRGQKGVRGAPANNVIIFLRRPSSFNKLIAISRARGFKGDLAKNRPRLVADLRLLMTGREGESETVRTETEQVFTQPRVL